MLSKNIDDEDDDCDNNSTDDNISRNYFCVNNFNVGFTRLPLEFLLPTFFQQKFVCNPHAGGTFLPLFHCKDTVNML